MKILFLRIGAIGDALLTTPAVKAVRQKYPDAEIHYLAGEKAAQILENNPDINKIIPFTEKYTHLPRVLRLFLQKSWFEEHFKNITYDLLIDFESSYYSAYMSLFIKAKVKAGFKINSKRRFLYNYLYKIRHDYKKRNKYQAERFLSLISTIENFPSVDNKLVLSLTNKEIDEGGKFYDAYSINRGHKKILISGSATWPSKKWPAEP